MNNTMQHTHRAVWVALGMLAGAACAGTTNGIPWGESFESYLEATTVNGTNGWSSERDSDGLATTNPSVVGLLASYWTGGGTTRLSGVTHTTVLKTTGEVCNEIRSDPGMAVAVDFLAMPVPVASVPLGDPDRQYMFCVKTNGHVVIWHRNMTGGAPGVNEWLELSGLSVPTGTWSRFTVLNDYARNRFQVSVNGMALTNAAGWAQGGTNQPGSWFYMVQTNGLLARVRFGDIDTNYIDDVVVDFGSAAALTYGTTTFTETATNNGTVNGTSLSLTNKAFAATNGEDLVASGKVTLGPLPTGLGLRIVRGATAQEAALVFTGAAVSNALADSVTNVAIAFRDAAFVLGDAAGVANASLSNLCIRFSDPRILTYSGSVFTEQSGGVIDSRVPVTITLSGDTFAGWDGLDFVAQGWIVASGLPTGLTARIVRTSATQLTAQLTGVAPNNATNNSVTAASFTFANGAFTSGNAAFVAGWQNAGIQVTFRDDTGFCNVMPYEEPFEAYSNGMFLAGTNGWSGDYPDAGIVTNDAGLAATEMAYLANHSSFPVGGEHRQVLRVLDGIRTEIYTEGLPLACLDFMTVPVPVDFAVDNDSNRQYAFYVNTNRQPVIWHRNMTGGAPGVPEWLTLASAPLVDTSKWTRFTVVQDFANRRFQLYINEGTPITDPAGWTEPGHSPTGSWFYMVQTNAYLTRFRMAGFGTGYIDDVAVRTSLSESFGQRSGAVFKFR